MTATRAIGHCNCDDRGYHSPYRQTLYYWIPAFSVMTEKM